MLNLLQNPQIFCSQYSHNHQRYNFKIILISQMEETRVGIRSKREIAPKVTHTKITISKSTPFLISKHHLDDSQMRSALQYDDQTVKNNHKRTYSYKGQVISCVNSKIKQKFETFQSPSNPIQRSLEKQKIEEYYPQTQNKLVQVESRILKSRIHSHQTQSSKINANKNTEVKNAKQTVKIGSNDYGMQEKQLIQARKNLQKQTQKLRKLYKKNVQYDLKSNSVNKITQLQQEIKQLKIKNLQIQKQKLLNELQASNVCQQNQKMIRSVQKSSNKFIYSILQKPKFKIKHEQNDETDSSFSSFEFE